MACQLFCSADVIVPIPAGHPAWTEMQYESLIIRFYLSFLSHEPWQLKGSNTNLAIGASGLVLWELWEFMRKFSSLPECMVQQMLQGTWCDKVPTAAAPKWQAFLVEEETRWGLVSTCTKGWDIVFIFSVWLLLVYWAGVRLNLGLIQRFNLDIFGDKEPSTVWSMLQVFLRATTAAQHLAIMPAFLTSKKLWPLGDAVGFGEVMLLLWDLAQPM